MLGALKTDAGRVAVPQNRHGRILYLKRCPDGPAHPTHVSTIPSRKKQGFGVSARIFPGRRREFSSHDFWPIFLETFRRKIFQNFRNNLQQKSKTIMNGSTNFPYAIYKNIDEAQEALEILRTTERLRTQTQFSLEQTREMLERIVAPPNALPGQDALIRHLEGVEECLHDLIRNAIEQIETFKKLERDAPKRAYSAGFHMFRSRLPFQVLVRIEGGDAVEALAASNEVVSSEDWGKLRNDIISTYQLPTHAYEAIWVRQPSGHFLIKFTPQSQPALGC
jgi:hypothetical protein